MHQDMVNAAMQKSLSMVFELKIYMSFGKNNILLSHEKGFPFLFNEKRGQPLHQGLIFSNTKSEQEYSSSLDMSSRTCPELEETKYWDIKIFELSPK